MVLDRIIRDAGWRHDSDFLWRIVGLKGQQVVLIKPVTYMNLSGIAVKKAMTRFGGKIGDLMVVHDDMDLAIGDMKMRQRGGSGGHKGVESVIYELEDEAFARLKIGIGHPVDMEVVQYVLEPFDPTEQKIIEDIIPRVVRGIQTWVRLGVRRAMNDFNRTRKSSFPVGTDSDESGKRDKGHKEVQ